MIPPPLLAALLVLLPLSAAADPAYLAELVDAARARALAERREWHNLLHYKPDLLGAGVHSLADDPGFFNAATGKTEPAAELEATLAAFFTPGPDTDARQPAQCRFIARYRWLKEELGFDARRLPEAECRRYRAWRAALDPHEITLVFAASYLNNPGSMYGHTLLRIDARGQDERTRLLAYAVSYAAATDETSGLVFAVRGLFGGYAGQFSVAPYYIKVREYSDLEHRDVWEYRLSFAPAEIERMLEHLWELGPTHFDYYFFDENCAYHLLSLFEVARPELDLTARFRWWALPSDTVAAVTETPGLLREAVYRPAAATVLRTRLEDLAPEHHVLVRDLAERRIPPDDARLAALAPPEQAAVLEAAYEYANYRRVKDKDEIPATAGYLRELLLARSARPQTAPRPVPVPAVRPDQGHATSRADLGLGREGGENYAELRVRPTYHDLLDPPAGYNRGAAIEYFALTLRQYESERLRLERFVPLEMTSLAPHDPFFRPLSWKVNFGWTRRYLPDGSEPLVTRLNGGAGRTWQTGAAGDALLALLLEGTADVDSELEQGYALGAGPSFTWTGDLAARWRFVLSARSQRFFAGDEHYAHELTLGQLWSLARDHALRLELGARREFEHTRRGGQLAWLVYF
jgi:hypothetical protein